MMARNHALALDANAVLCRALGLAAYAPPDMVGAMVTLPLPAGAASLQDVLLERYRIEAPIFPWPSSFSRCLRVTAQLYNTLPQYERLARALEAEFASRP